MLVGALVYKSEMLYINVRKRYNVKLFENKPFSQQFQSLWEWTAIMKGIDDSHYANFVREWNGNHGYCVTVIGYSDKRETQVPYTDSTTFYLMPFLATVKAY